MTLPSLRIVNSKTNVTCEPSCFTWLTQSIFTTLKKKICQIGDGQVLGIGELRWNDPFFSSITVTQWVHVLIRCKQELLKANSATFNGANTDFTTRSLSRLLSFLVPNGFPIFTKSQTSHWAHAKRISKAGLAALRAWKKSLKLHQRKHCRFKAAMWNLCLPFFTARVTTQTLVLSVKGCTTKHLNEAFYVN